MTAKFIEYLGENRYYSVFGAEERPVIVFQDHRFVIPLLWLARQTGAIGPGVSLFRFDAHLDCAVGQGSSALDRFQEIRTFSEAFEFARTALSDRDDDWLALALDADLVGRCVTVGPVDSAEVVSRYAQRSCVVRMLEGLLEARRKPSAEVIPSLWEAIDWPPTAPRMSTSPVLLDMDCDYFTFRWRGAQNAWLDRFYDREFDRKPVDCGAGQQLSPYGFMQSLIERAPFITIAVEPDFCGGESESRDILAQLNRRLFRNVIDINAIYA